MNENGITSEQDYGPDDEQNKELTLILDTGLFEDRETLGAALQLLVQSLNSSAIERRKLSIETMNDGDWDDILSLVLSAKRVITL